MHRNFLIAVGIGVLALVIFAYFIFGLNGGSADTMASSATAPTPESGRLRIPLRSRCAH